MMLSELLPHTAQIADELCVIRSMYTEAINHDPAITFFQTGSQLAGRPSIGSWLSYGLGTENQDLAGVCRSDLQRLRPQRRPAALRPALGIGFSADPASGREISKCRRSGPVSVQPGRGGPNDAPGDAGRTGADQPSKAGGGRATRRSPRGFPNTSWPFGCRRPCRN